MLSTGPRMKGVRRVLSWVTNPFILNWLMITHACTVLWGCCIYVQPVSGDIWHPQTIFLPLWPETSDVRLRHQVQLVDIVGLHSSAIMPCAIQLLYCQPNSLTGSFDPRISRSKMLSNQPYDLEVVPSAAVGPFRLGDSLWRVIELLRSARDRYQAIDVSWDHEVSL